MLSRFTENDMFSWCDVLTDMEQYPISYVQRDEVAKNLIGFLEQLRIIRYYA